MRVLLSPRRRDERGAVAIMTAFLMLVLCIMAAFVLDFGLAYNNKTQAQSAADAGALAAGKVYADAKAKCDPTLTVVEGGVFADAYAAAENVRKASMSGSDPGTLTVKCDKTDSTVKVSYDVPAKSAVGLGAFIIGDDHMDLERHAAVKWGTAQRAVGNLRPWLICGAQVPAQPFTNQVVEIGLPGNGHKPAPATCGTDQPGDWWRTQCLGGGGSANESYNAVLSGCTNVTIVPGSAGLTDKTQRAHVLLGACNTAYVGPSWAYPPNKNRFVEKSYCMKRDTGRDVKGLAPAWDTLIGQTVAMPVFCADDNCTPSSVVTNESKATWPVWKIAAVTICGYAMHGVYSPSTLPTGDCNDGNPSGPGHVDPKDFPSSDIGFLLIFKGILDSGDVASFPVSVSSTMRLVE